MSTVVHFFCQIHGLGMPVFAYTFDNELASLKWDYGGDVRNELDKFLTLGLDGYFADYPNTVRSFLESSTDCHGKNASKSINVTAAVMVLILAMSLLLMM